MTCGIEESGGKFPPLLINSVDENQKGRKKEEREKKRGRGGGGGGQLNIITNGEILLKKCAASCGVNPQNLWPTNA